MERAAARFLRYHRTQGSTEETLRCYRQTLEDGLIGFLSAQGHSLKLEDPTRDDVEAWLDWQRDRGLSQKTLHARCNAVKVWTRWLVSEEWLDRDPLAKLKRPKVDDKAKDTLSPADVDKLLGACDRKP